MRLIADTHTHTLASNHAYSTVMENIVAAREQGLLYMAMTEHGPKMPDAPHIWHCVNQWEVPSLYKGLNILHGIEVDVMDEEGTLDIDNKILPGAGMGAFLDATGPALRRPPSRSTPGPG